MRMRDLMRRDPWIVRETDALGAAQRTMARHAVRHLPVISDGRLTGILSERDLLAYRAKADPDEEWWKAPVSAAMTTPVQTAGPDDSLTEVAARLAASKLGAMPIVERGDLLGLVTATDVLAAEVQMAMGPSPRSFAAAEDVMTPTVSAIGPEATLLTAATLMVERGIRHLPVLDEAGMTIGMLSDRDVRDLVGDPTTYVKSHRRDPETTVRVRDAMVTQPITVREDRPLTELALLFADAKIGAVPVVTSSGALVGIVSYIDVLRALAS